MAPTGQKNAASRKPAYIKEPTADNARAIWFASIKTWGHSEQNAVDVHIWVLRSEYPAANKIMGSQTRHSIKIVKYSQ